MLFSRLAILFAVLLSMGMSDASFATQRSHGTVTKAEQSLRGTWYSSRGSITFNDNGTIHIKGKRYFYAVSNGGMIQLSGNRSSNAMAYQLSGGKLTLTIDGQKTDYFRKKPENKD